MISILILTKNEEQDLPGCLESVHWSDDIHIFDSYSDDQTIEIARSYGVKVTQRKFDNYASQRNAALREIDYKYSWVFILDADERIPSKLVKELESEIKSIDGAVNGFRIRRRDFLNNTWLKHAQISPFYVRLVRLGKASYHREINEVIEVDGIVKDINGYFDHYPFSKGYKHWLEKHNVYSSMEAKRWIDEHNGIYNFSLRKALFSKDFSEKQMPFRPLIKWLYMVVLRRAFLDGKAGMTYATLQSIYEYFIVLKTKELLQKK